ncbi:hypothetical protein [Caulifigura coniformis]|uniref:hypothetical protein n=1 Tax=Caulifigura coniformis TaxID=2527983 RepID=UPI0018D1FA49|nr:hypothetical protein [Caulifigura coniformis]
MRTGDPNGHAEHQTTQIRTAPRIHAWLPFTTFPIGRKCIDLIAFIPISVGARGKLSGPVKSGKISWTGRMDSGS